MKRKNSKDANDSERNKTVARLIDRLRDAGVYGKWLEDYHRMGMRYGPAYIFKSVRRFEQKRSSRS